MENADCFKPERYYIGLIGNISLSGIALSAELASIHSQIVQCTKCELHKNRKNTVPGEGPADAKIMFVGEGPGQSEDEQGRPFVGAAGKLLTELLLSIGLDRTQVFITNIVKCRPPSNRAPKKTEIETCNPYLQSQIRIINPRIVCPLGTPAITTIMGPQFSASRDHGKPVEMGALIIFPMYHPAAALYDTSLKEILGSDFQLLKKLLQRKNAPSNKIRNGQGSEAHESLEQWV